MKTPFFSYHNRFPGLFVTPWNAGAGAGESSGTMKLRRNPSVSLVELGSLLPAAAAAAAAAAAGHVVCWMSLWCT